jgi:hypothetical protein
MVQEYAKQVTEKLGKTEFKASNGCTELFGFFWTLSIIWYVEVLQMTTTFRRLDLSPSSGGWVRIDLLSWARQKELVDQ